MGALSRHMLHIYDNPSLKFKEIKDIFSKINEGKMQVTEKLDGMCVHLTYSVKEGKAKAARNLKNISDGGITLENVNLLSERQEALPSLTEALKVFEKTIKSIPIEDQIDLFGPNGHFYYNCEIKDPKNPNVIIYDLPEIVIHRTGHLQEDKYNKRLYQKTIGNQFLKLEKILSSNSVLNENTTDGFRVSTNPLRKLEALKNKIPYQNSLKSLQNEMSKYGMSDDCALGEYILNRVDEIVENHVPNLPKNSKMKLVGRLIKAEGISAKDVYENLNKDNLPHLIEKAKEVLKLERKILKEAISPIEEIVTEYGSNVLNEFKSNYIKNNLQEVKRLRTQLQEIFDIVRNSGNPEAQNFLNNQFKRIKDINNINSSCEGFVFKYDNNVYKLTGLFSALNQILGMKNYQRGNVAPLKTIAVMNENKTAVISWGRFNPPTIGHEIVFKFASDLAKQNKGDFFIIPTKTVDKEKNPLTVQEKISYINKIFPEYTNNLINSSQINTIIEAAKYISNKGYKNLKLVVGSDRKEQFELLNKYNNKDYSFNSIEIVSAGERLDEGEGAASMSASKMREAAVQGNIDAFMKGVAGRLELEEGIKLMNLIRSRIEVVDGDKKKFLEPISPSLLAEVIRKSGNKWCVFSKKKTKEGKKKKLGCYNSRAGAKKQLRRVEMFKHMKKNKSLKEEQELEEMNAMSGGPIAGSPVKEKDPWTTGGVVAIAEEEVEESSGASGYINTPGGLSGTESRLGFSTQKRDDEPSRKDIIKILIMQEEQFMINRKEFVEEIKLRKIVREGLKLKMKEREQKILQEEKQLRLVIRKLLQEADDEEAPHASTGINVLEDLLKKIIKIIKADYKRITTNPAQRKSFRAHIINATINALKTEKSTEDASDEEEEKLQEADEEEKVDPRFIDVGIDPQEPEPQQQDKFTIPGQDFTGRNMALKTMKKIEKQILESYQMLSDKKDKDLFYEYLIVNLKLYFDKFESEMGANTQEPDSQIYDQEKQQLDASPEPEPPEAAASSDLVSSNPEQAPPESPNPLTERRRKR